MAVSWILLLMSAAVFVAIILLAVVCLDCRNKGPLVSIRQASEEYTPSSQFRVIHPFAAQQTNDLNPVHSSSIPLSPFPNSADPGTQRRLRPYMPTETESNPSYENPGPESLESDTDDPKYIDVLPEGEAPPTNQSRASTPSSDVRHDYENIESSSESSSEKSSENTSDYLNVQTIICKSATPEVSSQSVSNSSDSDGEGNYVNQPPLIHS
ncbi:uncharacterized protein [Brachyistius frenatus]|uniref:uncharacterized protein isoform X1 n=1 Tax=Brachyistius frenatus TaxID=100188 RepID=UPI0037E83274